MAKDKTITRNSDYIPLKEKIVYGAADIYGGGQATLITLLLLPFFTKAMGVSPAIVGTVVLLSKGWDAISDPLMGLISDNTRSKWGRRKPYILFGGLLIIPALAMLFADISNFSNIAKSIYAAVAYIAYCSVSTLSQVAYCSLSGDISPDHKQRNVANLWKLMFDCLAAAICYLIPAILLDSFLEGKIAFSVFYTVIVIGFGVMFSVPLILCAFVVKERTPYDKLNNAKFNFIEYKDSFKIKSYKWHLVMYITTFLCMDLISSLVAYYTQDVLKGVTLNLPIIGTVELGVTYIVAPMMVFAAIMMPIAFIVMGKKSKQFAFRMGIPLYIIGGVLLACFQPSWNSILIPIFAIIMGIGLGGAQMMPWLVFPDTIDVAELKLGYRPSGAFSGIMTFSRKVSTAVAIFIVGWILQLCNYKETVLGEQVEQPASALLAIRIMIIVSVVCLLSLGFFASLKYKVTDKKLERIRYFNDIQREGNLDSLTEEEVAERNALIEELI